MQLLLGITKLLDLFSEKTLDFDDDPWMYLMLETVEEYYLKLGFLNHEMSFLASLFDFQKETVCLL